MAVLDFEERATVGQTAKRPAPQAIVAEPTRKRAPYAPRACDACRRRKGRCSGGNPCSYCFARSLHCGGAFNASSLSYCDESEPSAVVDQDASRVRRMLTPAPSSSSSRRTDTNTSRHLSNSEDHTNHHRRCVSRGNSWGSS